MNKLEKKLIKAKIYMHKAITALAVAGIGTFGVPSFVKADADIDWIKGEGNGAFDGLTTTVQQTGASGYKLMMAIGIIFLVVAVGISFLKLAGNGRKRDDGKDGVLWGILAACGFFGVVFIITSAKKIGGSL